MPYNLKDQFLYKSIRSDELDFWRSFCYGIANNEGDPLYLTRSRLRNPLPVPGHFRITREGVSRIGEKSLYTKEQKAGYSKHQSTTCASPKNNFCPPVFGHDKRSALVGVRFSNDNFLVQRVMSYDSGTISASYRDYLSEDAAKRDYAKLKNEKKIFDSLDELVTNADSTKLNEVMARLRWLCNESSQICIFTNTLPSKLLAQVRAQDLLRHLQGRMPIPDGYKVPISYYLPTEQGEKVWFYLENDQLTDRTTASTHPQSTPKEKALALFYEISATDFDHFDVPTVLAHLPELLNIASMLTYSSSQIFFEKVLCHADVINHWSVGNSSFWSQLFKTMKEDVSKTHVSFFKLYFPAHVAKIEDGYLNARLKSLTVLPEEVEELSGMMQKSSLNYQELEQLAITAAKKNLTPLLKVLLSNTKINITYIYEPLYWAVYYNHFDATNLLIEEDKKRHTNGQHWGLGAIIARYAQLNRFSHALGLAVSRGNEEGATRLLEEKNISIDICIKDVNVNVNDKTPLMCAILNGDIKTLVKLLDKGANPNLTPFPWPTPLMMAVRAGHAAIVLELIRAKATISESRYGSSALSVALSLKRHEIIKILIEHSPENYLHKIKNFFQQADADIKTTIKRAMPRRAVNLVEKQLPMLEKRHEHYVKNKPEKAPAVRTLIDALQTSVNAYPRDDAMFDPENANQFQQSCTQAITQAALVLNTPSWTSFFKNLALCFIGIGFITMPYRLFSGHYPFFQSKSEQIINKMNVIADNVLLPN